jgi:outer membrane lipoprotein-sorting protein
MTMKVTLMLFAAMVFARPSAALTGREIIDAAQKKHGFSTWKDRTAEMTMISYDKASAQRVRELTVTEQTDPRGEHRTFMEFTGPADVTGTLFLHLSPRNATDQQWLWTPATRRARRLPDAARDENFMGTDLSYRDLELIVRVQQWNDDEATATLLPDQESVEGHASHVVELVPKNKEFPYTKYKLWFGTDDYMLWRVEVYDEEKRPFKRVTFKNYERIQDYATARESEVQNLLYDTHTVYKLVRVKYNSDVGDDLFSVASVQKGR